MHRFEPAEVARVATDRSARPFDGSKEGERDARVFEAFEEGKGLREIVTTLRLRADLASKLYASWLKMGSNQDRAHADGRRPGAALRSRTCTREHRARRATERLVRRCRRN